jgi:hypothetical protein
MDGFVNDTGEFVLDPQATVAARNRDFFLRRSTVLAKKDAAQTAVAGGEVFFASLDAAAEVCVPTPRPQTRLDINRRPFQLFPRCFCPAPGSGCGSV